MNDFKINLIFWLSENWGLFIFLFSAIILINCLVFFFLYINLKKKRLNLKWEVWQQQKKERELVEKERKWNLLNLRFLSNVEKIKSWQKKSHAEEIHLMELNKRLVEKEKILTKQWENTFQKEEELNKQKENLREKTKKLEEKLWKVAQISKEEAKEILFATLKKENEEELTKHFQEQLFSQQKQAKKKSDRNNLFGIRKLQFRTNFWSRGKLLTNRKPSND